MSRQTVHEWLVKYANHGLPGLMDRSSKPQSCPHQMSPEIEARIIELRNEHPGWGPRTLRHQLSLEGFAPVPGRTSIYRCLVRHGLIMPEARRLSRQLRDASLTSRSSLSLDETVGISRTRSATARHVPPVSESRSNCRGLFRTSQRAMGRNHN